MPVSFDDYKGGCVNYGMPGSQGRLAKEKDEPTSQKTEERA